jgi:hypothetical protein
VILAGIRDPHLVLDPKAREYLPPDIVAYFDREVFVPAPPPRRVE